MNGTDRAASWSRFWAAGQQAASDDAGEYGFSGPIQQFWQQAFEAMQPSQRVLDLGAGNGPLVRRLMEQRAATGAGMPALDAVDLADIDSGWLDRHSSGLGGRVRMHAGVRMESLPFEDASFDWVLSQYGFEYAERGPATQELLRVLRPQGRVRMLLHHTGSRLVEVAREECGHLDWLLRNDGLLGLAADMLEPLARAATPEGRASLAGDARANALRQHFNQAMQALAQRAAESAVPDVLFDARETVAGILGSVASSGRAEAADAMETLRQALVDSQLRLSELRSHALDAAAIQVLTGWLGEGEGRVVSAEPIHHAQGALMGWALRVDPRA